RTGVRPLVDGASLSVVARPEIISVAGRTMITIDRILAIRASDISDFMCQRLSLPLAVPQPRSHSLACQFFSIVLAHSVIDAILAGHFRSSRNQFPCQSARTRTPPLTERGRGLGGPHYDSAFRHTMMRGLVDGTLGQVAVLSHSGIS